MPDIVITEFMDETAVEDLSRDYTVVYDPNLVDRPDEITSLLGDARALIVRNRTQVTGDLLSAGPALEVIGRLGVGLDNIDLDACAARGVAVCPATGANTVSVAEYVMGVMLLLLRGATYRSNDAMAAGDWPRTALQSREAAQRQIGLVGLGAIAREVARRALAFDMTVAAHDPYVADDDPVWKTVERQTMDELLSRSDVLTLHVPLTPETQHMIDADAIARMKPGLILINAARGGIVDEAAVTAALAAGRIGGVVLDVFENEPLDAEHGASFNDLTNLVLTPHVAGITDEANERTGTITAANVRNALENAK
jgi:(S)-sulfolactate dehydrogenase